MSRLPTKLECPGVQSGADGRCELRVEPGQDVRCRLLVYNAADRVDEIHARLSGPLADWVRVEPERLPLMPESEGVLELVLDLPGDARVEAGQHLFLVEIRSGLPETEPSVEECAVDVGRVTDAHMSVRPGHAGDRWHEVVVDSRANHPLRLELAAAAPVDVVIPRPVLDVPPFSGATAELRMAGEGTSGQQVNVEVTASGHGLQLRSQFAHTFSEASSGADTPPPPPRDTRPPPPRDTRPPPPCDTPPPPPRETPAPPVPQQSTEPPRCMGKAVLGVAVLAALYIYFTVQNGGLVVFLVVLEALWLLFGYAGCRVMASKGRSRWGGWLFGLLLGPIGLVIAAVLPDADVERQGGRA